MKTIRRIARFELSTMFYSPIAWLVLVIFMVGCGYYYNASIDILKFYFTSGDTRGLSQGATFSIFSAPNYGFFAQLFSNAFLLVPLLTMGLISKEISSGTIKLVLSSPITSLQLVLGKFLAILTYIAILSIPLFLIMIVSGMQIVAVDYKLILAGIFGFFLLTATYSAVGLFISSLTSYQVVAAVITLTFLGLLNFIGQLGRGIPFIEDLNYWLSLPTRSQQMVSGLISTKDISYFIIITIMFLAFTVFRISSTRKTIALSKKIGNYTLLFGAAVLLAYTTSLPKLTGYYDASRTKFNTLSKASEAVLKKIDGEITLTSYANVLHPLSTNSLPDRVKEDMNYFQNYLRYIPQLKMDYVYYYDKVSNTYISGGADNLNIEEQLNRTVELNELDKNLILSPEEIKKKIDLKSDQGSIVRKFSYKGKESSVRMFFDILQYPSEYETTAALKRLFVDAPKVVFATGHGERDIHKGMEKDYRQVFNKSTTRNSLINQGFELDVVNLKYDDMPKDTDVLVIADPKKSYSENVIHKINNYIANGGNALILTEPNNRAHITPITEPLGVTFMNGILQQNNKDVEPEFIVSNLAKASSDNEFSNKLSFFHEQELLVTAPTVMGIRFEDTKDFESVPLLTTSKANTKNAITDSIPAIPVDATTAMLLKNTKKENQRIIVMGDADVFSLREISRGYAKSVNAAIPLEFLGIITGGEYPIEIIRDEPKDMDYKMKDIKDRSLVEFILTVILPLIVLAFSAFILIRRKSN